MNLRVRNPFRSTLVRAACVALLAIVGAALAQDPLIVGGEDDRLPFTSLDASGEPIGFHVDLMREAAVRLGLPVRFEIGPGPPLRRALETGELHVLGMFVPESRAETVRFLDPHLIVYHRIYQPEGTTPMQSVRDFEGRTVLVRRDARGHEHLLALDLPNAEVVAVDDERAALRALADGTADAALLTEHRSRTVLAEEHLTTLTASGAPVVPTRYAFAVPPAADDLAESLNAVLRELRTDGTFDRLHELWLSDGAPPVEAAPFGPGRSAWVVLALATAALVALAVATAMRARRVRQVERRLARLGTHDDLTGLWNRHAFERHLRHLSEPSADGREREHVLASLHVDRFRLVNESLGHAHGDLVLQSVADAVRTTVRRKDAAARLGSDEFAVAFADLSAADAGAICERLVATVRELPFGPADTPAHVTVSIGIAPYRTGDGPAIERMRDADAACLAAKEVGGDRVHRWRPDDVRIAEQRDDLHWMRDLPAALAEDRVEAHFQAIVPADPSDRSLPSIELLARIRHPSGETIPAGRFMAAAERYGLAAQIDRRIVNRALAWLASEPEVRERLARVHVNLSGHSLSDPRFLHWFERRLDEDRDLLPSLCFEVTETSLIDNLDAVRDVFARLRTRGALVALDDFGVGSSSISYLRRLPVDLLKIDGAFVRDLQHDVRAAAGLIEQVRRLATSVGLRTVAEFVETDAVRARLPALGVDAVQGYGVHRPEALAGVRAWCAR